MNNPMMQFAMGMINQNPQVRNNPQTQQFLQILQNGDVARGEQMARNLCKTFNTSEEDAIRQARQFFHI